MPYTRADLQREAEEALDRIWFVQRREVYARTEITFAVRLYLREDLFVQAFLGEQSGALYFALIERGQRIFGMDREADEWHVHNYDAPDQHEMLLHDPGPRPLLAFLAHVEEILLAHSLL
jgi:hypothetical protein